MKHLYFILIANLVFSSSYGQQKSLERAHYIFPEFTQGAVLMKSGIKNEASLNYNSVTEEMIFDKKGKKLAMAVTDIRHLDTVFIKDRKFVVLNSEFVELLYNSKWQLFAEHKCKIKELGQSTGFGGTSETSSVNSHSSVIVGGGIYELELPDGYKLEPYAYYWLKKNGELNKIINLAKLKKLYKSKNDLYKTYVKKHHVKFEDQEGMIQLIAYLESN